MSPTKKILKEYLAILEKKAEEDTFVDLERYQKLEDFNKKNQHLPIKLRQIKKAFSILKISFGEISTFFEVDFLDILSALLYDPHKLSYSLKGFIQSVHFTDQLAIGRLESPYGEVYVLFDLKCFTEDQKGLTQTGMYFDLEVKYPLDLLESPIFKPTYNLTFRTGPILTGKDIRILNGEEEGEFKEFF